MSATLIVALVLGGCVSWTTVHKPGIGPEGWVLDHRVCRTCGHLVKEEFEQCSRAELSRKISSCEQCDRYTWGRYGQNAAADENIRRWFPQSASAREIEKCLEDKGYERQVHWESFFSGVGGGWGGFVTSGGCPVALPERALRVEVQ